MLTCSAALETLINLAVVEMLLLAGDHEMFTPICGEGLERLAIGGMLLRREVLELLLLLTDSLVADALRMGLPLVAEVFEPPLLLTDALAADALRMGFAIRAGGQLSTRLQRGHVPFWNIK